MTVAEHQALALDLARTLTELGEFSIKGWQGTFTVQLDMKDSPLRINAVGRGETISEAMIEMIGALKTLVSAHRDRVEIEQASLVAIASVLSW